ncbi:DUF3592 domain-containing protein [Mariniblastus fucicola]|uniref:DUF3592 domain-containing protein n=1 Tax=Mariniblastus fucicola TaxID=980251 RepID=A0A5B9PJS2_9BACT|nr:DUF3592 domain-containing protein [Mariniblastus fucicola]QEG24972.1 hypothetical protein MFFC18_48950 [Mariniblastus fucicola]
MNNPATKPRFALLEWLGVAILLGLLIGFLLWPAFGNIRDSFHAADWQTTQGKVIESSKRRYTNENPRTRLQVRFRYEYQVDNQAYIGWRYSFGSPGGSQSSGVNLLDAEQSVKVHYDPNHPSRSVIDVETSPWWNYVVLGVIFSAMFFAGLMAWLARSRDQASKIS